MNNPDSILRIAAPADAAGILEIYTPYITHSAISFEISTPDEHSFADKMAAQMEQYPWLVYEEYGDIKGYAYAGGHRSRSAYQWNAESSVYITKSHQGRQIATALYGALIDILVLQGYCNVLAGIVEPNAISERFHASAGFKKIGTYKQIGYKLDAWHDVGWWELFVGKVDQPPGSIASFSGVKSSAEVQQILDLWGRKI